MNSLKTIVFYDSENVTDELVVMENNNLGSQLVIEVRGSSSVVFNVEGIADPANADEWNRLAVIKAKDYTVSTSMSDTGIYYVGVDGIRKIRVNPISVNGDVRVFGTLGN